MISLEQLHALVEDYGDDLDRPVRPLRLGPALPTPAIMGVVNMSRDSTYRSSIAPTFEAAVRRAVTQVAQGAHIVDLGSESTTAKARIVDQTEQERLLAPVIRELAGRGQVVSVECRQAAVARSALEAGAKILNYTGHEDDGQVFDLAAEHGAAVIVCYVPGRDVRDRSDAPTQGDPVPQLIDHFGRRCGDAERRGVEQIVIDPGLGFYYGNLVDPLDRLRYQFPMLLQSFRLKALGYPVCQALPHALEVFETEYRHAEGFFAVWARLAQVDVVRTHEVAVVRAVLRGMAELGTT